jgi:hypothetical protein
MSPLPLPVRVAAGLLASAVEQARELPRLVVELPVTAVSQALQASMRVQQKVTELAIKGDQALSTLRSAEERPSWATFDDEDETAASGNGAAAVTELRPHARPEPDPPTDTAVETAAATTAAAAEGDTPERTAPAQPEAAGPNALPGYQELTIPQLRGRLRHLTADDLRALLAWETTHDNRAPYVTMLTNRITTVTEG